MVDMKMKVFKFFVLFAIVLLCQSCFIAQEQSKVTLNYIETYKDLAMREMQEYKIPASITLAQGILETSSGTSELFRKSNNHFGIKCHKGWTGKTVTHDDDEENECFRAYDTSEDSYRDHSLFLTQRKHYARLFDLKITDYKGWAKELKEAGYATSKTYSEDLIKQVELYNLARYDDLVLKGKFKYKEKKNRKAEEYIVYSPFKIEDAEVVGITSDGRFIRENNNVRFVFARNGETVSELAEIMEICDKQIIKYNDLGKRKMLRDNEIVYIGSKKNKAMRKYKYHTVQKGETLSHISRLYAVKLSSLFRMNDMDENTVLHVGDNIRLR